jgi:hypothetical protein
MAGCGIRHKAVYPARVHTVIQLNLNLVEPIWKFDKGVQLFHNFVSVGI